MILGQHNKKLKLLEESERIVLKTLSVEDMIEKNLKINQLMEIALNGNISGNTTQPKDKVSGSRKILEKETPKMPILSAK
jgi:hypothetical protein